MPDRHDRAESGVSAAATQASSPGAPLAIRTHRDDNVVIAVGPIRAGSVIDAGLDSDNSSDVDDRVVAAVDFALGQKIAARPIEQGQTVVRYGEPIGVATADISTGELVHDHNLASTYQGGVTRRTEQATDHG